MRVLHVINSISGSGGAEQGLVREITRFRGNIHQRLVTLYDSDALASPLADAGIERTSLGLQSSNSGWNWMAGVKRLRPLLEEFDPDVVQSSLASGNLVAQVATIGTGIPVVSTFTLSGRESLMRAYQPGADTRRAALLRRLGARASRRHGIWFRALTTDAKTTNCAAAGIDPSRVEVIPRGVPPPPRAPTRDRADLGLPEDVPVLLNVGRQTAQKGHGDLIDVFVQLLDHEEAHLVILGREGDTTPDLRRAIARHELASRVTVIPYTDRPYDYYLASDVFVFPSLMEGLGTAVLEAMSCALPVVAYEIPPVREILDSGRLGRLVPVGDVKAMSAAVQEVLERPREALALARTAQQEVAMEYSLDRIAERVQSLLETVVSAGIS